MGIMAGLLEAPNKLDISDNISCRQWKWLLSVDLFYLNFLKEARYTRSNDLLYVYCTEYSMTDIVGQMHPNSSNFSAFKLRMNEYMKKFYNACVEKRLSEMFGFYKSALKTLQTSRNGGFYGTKILEDTLNSVVRATDPNQIFNEMDDVYLTLKNYLKFQINQTPEMISNEIVDGFINKIEAILLSHNEGLDDDQYRRKICRVIETANLFITYSGVYTDAEDELNRRRWYFDNRALVTYDQMWKYMVGMDGTSNIIQKGLPYKHIDIDAAVCIFPETTDYPLLQEEFTKQYRPSNQNSEHLINDWLMRWFLVGLLAKAKKREDRWAREDD